MAGKKLATRRHFLKSLALGSAFISYWPYNMQMAIASEHTNRHKSIYLFDEKRWYQQNISTYADSIKGVVTDLIVMVYGHHNGGTMGWKSSLIHHIPGITGAVLPGNQLRVLIAAMHSRGIRVHADFSACRSAATGGLFPPYEKGATFVDIHNPEFQEFISDLTADCAGQGVDGICLDFIRTLDVSDPAKNHVSLENIVRMVYEKVKIVNPNCIVSSTTAPYYDTVNPVAMKWGRKAINWANKGYQDIIFDMNYGPYHKNGVGPRLGKDGDPPHMSYIYEGRKLMKDPEKLIVMAGNYKFGPVPSDSVRFEKVLDTIAAEETIAIYTGWLLSNEHIALLKEVRGLPPEPIEPTEPSPPEPTPEPEPKPIPESAPEPVSPTRTQTNKPVPPTRAQTNKPVRTYGQGRFKSGPTTRAGTYGQGRFKTGPTTRARTYGQGRFKTPTD